MYHKTLGAMPMSAQKIKLTGSLRGSGQL